jgi:hypothetical protein
MGGQDMTPQIEKALSSGDMGQIRDLLGEMNAEYRKIGVDQKTALDPISKVAQGVAEINETLRNVIAPWGRYFAGLSVAMLAGVATLTMIYTGFVNLQSVLSLLGGFFGGGTGGGFGSVIGNIMGKPKAGGGGGDKTTEATNALYFSDSGEWQKDDGHVLVLRPGGRLEVFAGPFAFPNGLSLSADERTLYIVESTDDAVTALPIRPDGSAGRPRKFVRSLQRVPDGCGFDDKGNLYVTTYASDDIYKVTTTGKVSLVAHDPHGTMLASPTNVAFDGEGYMYFANLSRWHICLVHAGVKGQRLAGER